jgi:thiamine transport system permease protein
MDTGKQVDTKTGARTSLFTCLSVYLSTYHRLLLWFLPLVFLGLFFFYPFARIISLTFNINTLAVENLQLAFSVLRFTLFQAVLSTLLTLLLGLPSAHLFARFEFRGKSLLRALTAVPFMLPTVVVAAGFNALLGPRGWLSFLFPLSSFQFIGTLPAILLAHIFYNTTIVIRIVGNALSRLDPRLDQAARTLGADNRRAWQRVTLPLLMPALTASTLLVFLFDFTSFGVILLLGGPSFSTLEVEIYIQAVKRLNLPLAALLSLIQLICTLVFSILYTRVISRNTVQTSPRSAESNIRKPRTLREKLLLASFVFLLASFFIAPLLALPLRSFTRLEADRGQRGEVQYGFTTDYYAELFINRRGSVFYVPPIRAALNSLGYAAATVFLSLLFGLPAASALAKPTRLERILDPLLMLPLGASAVTLGLGFIVSFNRPLPTPSSILSAINCSLSAVHRSLITDHRSLITDHCSLITETFTPLASPLLVPLAHTLIALPFVIRTLQPALASIPDGLRHAAATLGASPFQVWKNVDWPILSRAALSAATFAFTVSLGEFGAAILLTRPEYPTISVAISRFLAQPGGLNYGQAMAMATILLAITALGILLIEKIRLPGAGEF